MLGVDTEDYVVKFIDLIGQYLEEKLITRGNPADNSGSEYENDKFLISAYDWREDLPEDQVTPNFWYKPTNYQVEWYKHAGRGTYSNKPISIDDAISMFLDVIASLQDAAAVVAASDIWEDDE